MNIYNPQHCYFIVLTINFIRGKKGAVPRNWGTALFIDFSYCCSLDCGNSSPRKARIEYRLDERRHHFASASAW